jgi:hypothetical protein
VGYVNWYDALAYCNALSEREGLLKRYDLSCCEGVVGEGCPKQYTACYESSYRCDCAVDRFENHYECPGYRLPTSAEWQYAARAGTTTATYNGDLPSRLDVCAPQEVLDPIAWHCGNTDRAMPVGQKEPNAWGLHDMLEVFPGTPADLFWTSSSYDTEWAWPVSMDMGRLEYLYKDFGALVRCVRRQPGGIPERFERTEPEAGEPVVWDQVTGLLWQGCAAGQAGDAVDCVGEEALYPGGGAEGAATYCDDLAWGGYKDWRLPDIKELASLSDTRAADAAIDAAAFPDTPPTWFWSSTPYVPYPDHAWFLDFGDGHANIADQTYAHAVRCAR